MRTRRLPRAAEARGWLTDAETECLITAAREVERGGTIVNVGVEYGKSVICFLEGRRDHSVQVLGIDIDLAPWKEMGYPRVQGLYVFETDSGHFAIGWERKCGLIFIDGDHTYEGVRRDLLWAERLLPGAQIIFHDCYSWPPDPPRTIHRICPEVNQAVEEWFRENEGNFYELEPIHSMRRFRSKR